LQLLGGGLFLAFNFPAVTSFPQEQLKFIQFWCGGALGTPIGVIIGSLWQHAASAPIPKSFMFICGVCSFLLPIAAAALIWVG
jgi:hypothetical protein